MIMDRRTLLLSAAVLAVAPCTRAEEPQRVRRAGPPPALVATGDSAHLTLNGGYNLPTVEVAVNGGQPLWFGIDTGAAGYGRISAAVAESLNMPVVGEALAGDPSGKNPQRRRIFQASSLNVGGVVFTNPPLVELSELGGMGPKLDGILGLDLFQQWLLTFDGPAGTIGLVSGALPDADGQTIFQSPMGPTLRVDILVGNVRVTCDLDTGQQRAPLIVAQPVAATLKTAGEPHSAGTAHTVSQTIEMFAARLDAPVYLGSVPLTVPEIAWPAPTPVGNLGWQGVRDHILTVDATNRRIRIA